MKRHILKNILASVCVALLVGGSLAGCDLTGQKKADELSNLCKRAYSLKKELESCENYCFSGADFALDSAREACLAGQSEYLKRVLEPIAGAPANFVKDVADWCSKHYSGEAWACIRAAATEDVRFGESRPGSGSASDRETGNFR